MKICCDHCMVLLIALMWSRWVWLTKLLDLVRVVPLQHSLLFQQLGQGVPPSTAGSPSCGMATLSGVSLEPEGFLGKLPSLSAELWESLFQQSMRDISGSSVGDLVDKVWFSFLPLWQKELILWLEFLNKILVHSLGFRSAISAFHKSVDSQRIMECSEITRLLRGVFDTRPHQRVLFPTWILVLEALSKAHFELLLEVSVKYLTYKNDFLLLLCRVMQWFGAVRP